MIHIRHYKEATEKQCGFFVQLRYTKEILYLYRLRLLIMELNCMADRGLEK